MKALIRITSSYFCAGVIVEGAVGSEWRCVESARILRWTVNQGYSPQRLQDYCKRKNWTFELVSEFE